MTGPAAGPPAGDAWLSMAGFPSAWAQGRDDAAYTSWLARKAARRRTGRLTCGCPYSHPVYIRGCCDDIVCERHSSTDHHHGQESPDG